MPDKKKNPHKDHRKRMREEIMRQNNFDALEKHRLLELLLFGAIPRKDTNEIAHELLETFGSVAGVLDAEVHDLAAVKGMTQNAAIHLKTVMPLARHYQEDKFKKGYKFQNIDEMGSYLIKKHLGKKNETLAITCLDSLGKFIACEIVNEGSAASVDITFRDIAACVLKHNAQWVIVSHNHSTATALPSEEDITMTIELRKSLSQLNVQLLDHIIISGDDYISMRQTAKLASIFK